MNISIIGVGYLGLTTASVLANAGFRVYALDINEEVVNTIKSKKSHFYEPGLDELVKQAIESGNLIPTTRYQEAIPNSDISFICVDTVGQDDGSLSIKSVESATYSLAEYMNNGHVLVVKSTVPAGTNKIIRGILDKTGKEYSYVSKPEFLAEGSAVLDTMFPDRIIIGTDDDNSFDKLFHIFEEVDKWALKQELSTYSKYSKTYRHNSQTYKLFRDRVIRVSVESAEIIKVTSNSFLALKISFANMISRLADKTGGKIGEIMDGVGADPRIGRDFLYAGLGWGGGCFPKDVKGLIKSGEDFGCDFELLRNVYYLNESQIDTYLDKIQEATPKLLSQSRVGVMGLSFKPGTDDIRLSPATKLVSKLALVAPEVRVTDPKSLGKAREYLSNYPNVVFFDNVDEMVDGIDVLILATEWPEYIGLNYEKLASKMREKVIVDARNRLDREVLIKLGFNYISLG